MLSSVTGRHTDMDLEIPRGCRSDPYMGSMRAAQAPDHRSAGPDVVSSDFVWLSCSRSETGQRQTCQAYAPLAGRDRNCICDVNGGIRNRRCDVIMTQDCVLNASLPTPADAAHA